MGKNTVVLENVENIEELFGSFDENVKLLEKEYEQPPFRKR